MCYSKAVRTKSVMLIGTIPSHFKYSILHPLKPTVIKSLGKIVDDRKRIVRKSAANARLKWYLMATKD